MLQLETKLEHLKDLKQTLENLIDFISSPKNLQDHLAQFTFIYPEFGSLVNGEFKKFDGETEKLREKERLEFDNEGKNYCSEFPYFTSETLFFRTAAEYKELHPLILKYVDHLIRHSREAKLLWSHDETPAGTDAIESLVFKDQKYLPKYIEFLRTNDMDHEVYQDYGIGYIIKKYGWNEDTVRLAAVRLGVCHGQHGDENINLLLESAKLDEFLKVDRHAVIFLKYLSDEFQTLLKERGYNKSTEEMYIETYCEIFEDYPVILEGVKMMRRKDL